VAGVNGHRRIERCEHAPQAVRQSVCVTAREVGPTTASDEERVAGQKCAIDEKALAAGGMSGVARHVIVTAPTSTVSPDSRDVNSFAATPVDRSSHGISVACA